MLRDPLGPTAASRLHWLLGCAVLAFLASHRAEGSSEDKYQFKKSLTVTTVEIEPYFMLVNDSNSRTKRYEGYVVDLVKELADLLGFSYRIRPALDGQYGHRRPDGTWSGMIGEVMTKQADFAAAPLFITEHRLRVVKFSEPFLNVKATILLRRPPNGQESHIKTLTDLINQSEIKYGTLNTGLIIWSFKNTNDSIIKIMWRNMQRFADSVFTESNEEGITKVRHEKYAYIIPSTIGEYIAKRQPCDLITMERFLMDRGYGLAVRKDSPYLQEINKALKTLKTNGFLKKLYYKWWVGKSDCNGVRSSKIYSVNSSSKSSITILTLLSTFSFLCR